MWHATSIDLDVYFALHRLKWHSKETITEYTINLVATQLKIAIDKLLIFNFRWNNKKF